MKLYKNFLFTLIIGSGLLISSPVFPEIDYQYESEEINLPNKNIDFSQPNPYHLNKTVIKAVEHVVMYSYAGNKKIKARIDTGATQSSIDLNLAKELGYNKYVGQINVVSANGTKTRPLVEISYELSGKRIKSMFSIADRKNLNYSILIGRSDLEGFLVDPSDD